MVCVFCLKHITVAICFHPTCTFDPNHHLEQNRPDFTLRLEIFTFYPKHKMRAEQTFSLPPANSSPSCLLQSFPRRSSSKLVREKHMPVTWRAVCIHPQTYRQIFLPPLPVSLQRVLYWAYVSLADCLAVLVWNNQCQGECICFTRNRFNPSERLRTCPTHPPWNGSWCTEWPNDMDVTFPKKEERKVFRAEESCDCEATLS